MQAIGKNKFGKMLSDIAKYLYNCIMQIIPAIGRTEKHGVMLKSRFRCLCRQRVLMYSPKTAGSIIVACVVLHNIMIYAKYPLPREEDIAEEISDDESENENEEYDALPVRNIGNAARTALIREHFQ